MEDGRTWEGGKGKENRGKDKLVKGGEGKGDEAPIKVSAYATVTNVCKRF